MDALDASAQRNVELVAQVWPEHWDIPTPCAEWSVSTLVGHLIAGRGGYAPVPAEPSGARPGPLRQTAHG